MDNQNPQQSQPTTKRTSKKPLIISLVVGAVLLIAGVVLALNLIISQPAGEQANPEGAQEEVANSPVVASSLVDFTGVCENTPVGNAANYTSPSEAVIVGALDTVGSNFRGVEMAGYDKAYYPDSENVETTNVVACITPDEQSRTSANKCQYEGVEVDYYGLTYKVELVAAKDLKELESTTIKVGNQTCPSSVAYNKQTKEAFAVPATAQLEAVYDAFIGGDR